MRYVLTILAALFTTCVSASELTREEYDAARAYIIECATDWANSVVTGDSTRKKIYFADDFQGTGIDGSRYDKADVTKSDGPSKTYVSNTVNEVDVRFFGTTAIAYGDETWAKADGTSGKWIWTDIWLYRSGEWQLVAAQDVEVVDDV